MGKEDYLTDPAHTKKIGLRFYFPIVFEFELDGILTTHAFTMDGASLDSVFPSTSTNTQKGRSYTPTVGTNAQYEYVGYKEIKDGVPGSLITGAKPQAFTYDGTYDTKNINLYYTKIENAGVVHVRHMVRTSATDSFSQKGQSDVAIGRLPDTRTLSPDTSYGNVLGSSLTYTGGYSDTISTSKTVTTSLTTSKEEAWVTFFYENAGNSITGDFDVLPSQKIKNGDTFTLHPKDFKLQSCTYRSHRFKIERAGITNILPTVTNMNQDSVYAKADYPAVIEYNSTHQVYLQIFTSCGETPWIGPKPLELADNTSPPVIEQHGPYARITGPTRVKAGQPLPFPIDGSNSGDWDGKKIVDYNWDYRITSSNPLYDINQYDTPGTYTATLHVRNSAGVWSDEATHTIEVVPNEPPVALISVPSEGTRLGMAVIQSNAFSSDGDLIVSHKFQVKYDAKNNGFADDAWQTVQEGESSTYAFKPSRIGNYLFGEVACEPGNICDNTDDQPEEERTLWIDNLAPTADVKTSSPVNDPDTRTLLPMDTLYNNGQIVSLENGGAGDKNNWQVSKGELSTKTYRTDLGMFNHSWGVPDNYFGDDFWDRTLFASIQNTPTLTPLGSYFPSTSRVTADEKYVYAAYPVADNQTNFFGFQINKYSRDNLQLIGSSLISAGFNLEVENMMVKGDQVYVTVLGTNGTAAAVTFVIKRETLAQSFQKPFAFGFASDPYNNGYTYPALNGVYADSKGLIGTAYSYYGVAWYARDLVQFLIPDTSNAITARTTYDFSSTEGYFGNYFANRNVLQNYISQKNNSVYYDSDNSRRMIIYNQNQVQVGAFEDPPQGRMEYTLLGLDDKRNYYSVARKGFYEGNPILTIHNSSGKLIKSWPYPDDMTKEASYKSSDGSRTTYYYTEDTAAHYTVDPSGNIWTATNVKGKGFNVVVLTPNGEEKLLLPLPILDPTDVFNILVGSDGLVSYFMYTDTRQSLKVVVFDPKTFQVVSDTTLNNFASPYTVPGIRDHAYVMHYQYPFYVIPLADQKYLITSYHRYGYLDMPSYILSASGPLTYNKMFDVGVPTKDFWLGDNVAANLAFQGDLRVDTTSTAGAGYVYLAQDKNNYYSAEFENGQFKVKKTANGATSTVFAKALSFVQGQQYTIRFVPEAGGFSVYVNRVKQATITETAWTIGKYGVISRGQQGVAFMNAVTDVPGKQIGSVSGVVLVGETLNYDVIMDDPEKDPRVTAVETWTYTHNPNVFLQPQGTWSDSGKQVKSPVTTFSLPGEYTFKFKTVDDPNPDYLYPSNVFADYRKESNEVTGKIRVHRRPVAVPGVTVDASQKVSYTDDSYDPDRYNPATGQYSTEATGIDYAATHGVITRTWRYRLENSSSYTYGQPARLSAGKYVFELNVTDEYGANSGWVSVPVTVEGYDALPPNPGFTTTPTTTYRGVPITIDSTASDPQDGDRTNLDHVYYIKNLTTGGSESLQSTVRTTWVKTFNTLGQFNIRQVVTNSYGLSAEISRTVNIINRKPAANITVPASADRNNPTLVRELRPEFDWTYQDADNDPQTMWQIQIYKYDGSLRVDTGPRGGANLTWTPTADLDDNEKYYVQIRVFDGYDWGDWSSPKYFRIETNKPPTADFQWTPTLVYEGDTVTFTTLVDDPDRDLLDVTYVIESPSGSRRTYADTRSYPYATTGPSVVMLEPGVWTVTLKASDRKAPEVSVAKTIRVWPLGLSGQVRHTDAWEANRLRYNAKHPGAERPANWFWAGEAFVLEGLATDTGSSATKAMKVIADAGGGLRMTLTAANPPANSQWTGTLGSKEAGFDLTTLPEGDYTFTFTVTYSNGVVKTAQATIHVADTIDDYVKVHRLQ